MRDGLSSRRSNYLSGRGADMVTPNKFSNVRSLSVKLNAVGQRTRQEVGRAVKRGGLAIENTAVDSIKEQTPGGRAYPSRGDRTKLHFASPAGSPPNADTGELDTGITSTQIENGPERFLNHTASNAPYGPALEFGTSRMSPRPFMGPAFDANKAAIEANIRAAIIRGARSGGKR